MDPGVLLALARFGAAPCILLGQDRHRQRRQQPLGPAGLRAARRGIRIAAQLDLPLVTVVDTAGAALSKEAEEGGLAGEIARCLADLVTLPAPTLCLLLGEGAGGGALAFLPTDRVVAAQHAWLSPLPPEGASAVLYRTTERAVEVAERQGVGVAALRAHRIVDRVIPELPDAADEGEAFLQRVGGVLEAELAGLLVAEPAARYGERRRRYRTLGLTWTGPRR
jgi:acetyl-CoA carboxylase carboxyl transferase subunit beta